MNGILHKSSKIWEDKEGVVLSWKSRKKGMTPVIRYYRETTEDKEWRPRRPTLLRKIFRGALGMEDKLQCIEKSKGYNG